MEEDCRIIKLTDYLREVIDNLYKNSMGLKTGISKLDSQIRGLKPTELIILAGRPSMGKTSLMVDAALNISKSKTILIFSLETSAKLLIERMLANTAKISYLRLKANSLMDSEKQRVEIAEKELMKREIYIDESSLITPIDIFKRIKKVNELADGGIDCVFIDYLQLMVLHKAAENRNQELSVICRHLKSVAKRFDIPIVVLSQLNRAVEYRESNKPRLSDLRDSGAIEQDADIVLLLHRPDYYTLIHNPNATATGQANIIIAKNRNGAVGIVPCIWDGQLMSFSGEVGIEDF